MNSTKGAEGGFVVDDELKSNVMLERVELIARLTVEGVCQERDREIALDLIAELARGKTITNDKFVVSFSATPSESKQ